LTLLAKSHEPVRMAGEVAGQVPTLSLAVEAIEMVIDCNECAGKTIYTPALWGDSCAVAETLRSSH
jgi:hypothetical protein